LNWSAVQEVTKFGCLPVPDAQTFVLCSAGTWKTYIIKHESVWHKVRSDVPMEYAGTVTVNPLTALRILQDFVKLNPGDAIVQKGATSIVVQCVIQLAKVHGIHTINIIRDRPGSEEAKDKLNSLVRMRCSQNLG